MNYSHTIPHYHSIFPGESYLDLSLPNYERERRWIVVKLVAAVFVFFAWLPNKFVFQTVVADARESKDRRVEPEPNENGKLMARVTKKNGNDKKKQRRKKDKAVKFDNSTRASYKQSATRQEEAPAVEIDQFKSSLLTILGVLAIFLILLSSDDNLFPARRILRAPLFTERECERIVKMAVSAAGKNAERAELEKKELLKKFPQLRGAMEGIEDGSRNETEVVGLEGWAELKKLNSLLRSPAGWKKDRHTLYPTTDLNLVTDPFTAQNRHFLQTALDARLSPLIERAYGIWRGAVRANDMFVVRYDGEAGQDSLRVHTDSSHLSFNVLLNDGFEGGGTRFHDRTKNEAIDIHPEPGEALLSHAMILHEGLPTTSGTRYILVGFNSIDTKDPLTREDTGLSIFSSWLNFAWMQVRFREGAARGAANRRKRVRDVAEDEDGGTSRDWKESKYTTSLFRDLDNTMTWLSDKFAPLKAGKLIKSHNFDEYIHTMDRAFAERVEHERNAGIERMRSNGYSSWFQGQNLHLDVFGNYDDSWTERKDDEEKFRSKDL